MTKRTKIKVLLTKKDVGQRYVVMGWVKTRRDSKAGFSFLEINDGSCLQNLQVVADSSLPNYESEVLRIGTGCAVKVE
ncbi:MAG TPA: asparagine--tRNA ligase, partial [Desulfobacterales bacterium]|nr:asparagine--tRNA ligase [Desulfobacterales bacterium]